MLNNFLNQTCDIKQINKVISWWEEVKTETTIYTAIPCYYYNSKQTLDETNLASNTDLSRYKIMLEPSKTLVRQEMILSLIDPDLWNIWDFIITWVKINRLINWTKDSIELQVKKI